jgi:hypothetical protein
LILATDQTKRKTPNLTPEDISRFWSKAAIRDVNDCWHWLGAKTTRGYGEFSYRDHPYQAHRIAYQIIHGPIPSLALIDHVCFNRDCVNPNHLRIATDQENMQHRSGANSNNHSSGIRGVSWHKQGKKWRVYLTVDHHQISGGLFDSLSDAEKKIKSLRTIYFEKGFEGQ